MLFTDIKPENVLVIADDLVREVNNNLGKEIYTKPTAYLSDFDLMFGCNLFPQEVADTIFTGVNEEVGLFKLPTAVLDDPGRQFQMIDRTCARMTDSNALAAYKIIIKGMLGASVNRSNSPSFLFPKETMELLKLIGNLYNFEQSDYNVMQEAMATGFDEFHARVY